MPAMEIPSLHNKGNFSFMTALSSAACEWVLLFLLFVDAALSCFLTKFAEYCKLQLPCVCSRIDFDPKNKPELYFKMLCSSHRPDVSSLVSCHTHEKLADVWGLCEECLLSYAPQNKSNTETYRLKAGRLGLQNPLLKNDACPGCTIYCSCCGKASQNAQKLLQIKPFGKPDTPLPSSAGQKHLNRQNGLKKIQNTILRSRACNRLGNDGFDPFSHVGYSELKMSSDAEFDERNLGDGTMGSEEIPWNQNKQSPNPGSSLLGLNSQPEASEPLKPLPSDAAVWHGLKELNWQQVHQKSNPIGLPEIISLDAPVESTTGHGYSKEEDGDNEDLKQTGTESSCGDESQILDRPSSNVTQKPNSLERNGSLGFESVDGDSICEVESINSFDKLKQKTEHDQRCIDSLYKEVEEERSAAAIAANQAMAMINRLQEEKAATLMEALQYLRMLEEQAEYDVEALQKANDLLSEREKDIQDLEAELELLRARYCIENNMHEAGTSSSDIHEGPSLTEFGEEKNHISESLKKLEVKLKHALNDEAFVNPSNNGDCLITCCQNLPENHEDIDFSALRSEVSELGGRLKALEADLMFLKQASHSLRKGNEGLEFIEEIAHPSS